MKIHKFVQNPDLTSALDSADTASNLSTQLYGIGQGEYGTPPDGEKTIAYPGLAPVGEGSFAGVWVVTWEDAQALLDTAANSVTNTELKDIIRGQLA